MTHARIMVRVIRWMVAALALLVAAEVAAGAEGKGKVVDPQGNAVKGAKVYLIQSNDESMEVLAESTSTDGKGEFILANVDEKLERRAQMVAMAEGSGIGASLYQKDKPT